METAARTVSLPRHGEPGPRKAQQATNLVCQVEEVGEFQELQHFRALGEVHGRVCVINTAWAVRYVNWKRIHCGNLIVAAIAFRVFAVEAVKLIQGGKDYLPLDQVRNTVLHRPTHGQEVQDLFPLKRGAYSAGLLQERHYPLGHPILTSGSPKRRTMGKRSTAQQESKTRWIKAVAFVAAAVFALGILAIQRRRPAPRLPPTEVLRRLRLDDTYSLAYHYGGDDEEMEFLDET